MILAQARESHPGEGAISLRRVILAWARLQIEGNYNSGRILAQASPSRLGQSVSHSSETNSPRRQFT